MASVAKVGLVREKWNCKKMRIIIVILRTFAAIMKENAVRIIGNALVQAKHPSLRCHYTSELIINGKLTVEGRVNIGKRTRIHVSRGCHLILHGENDILDDVLLGPGYKMSIGKGTSIQAGCILLGCIELGSYCLLAPRVFASSGQHSFKGHGKLPAWTMIKLQDAVQPDQGNPIKIGSDCWLGINSVILPGCQLAKGSVVAAGAVVRGAYHDAYSIIAGVPAASISKRWIDFAKQLPLTDLGG